jgi:hypothetical protein
MVCDTLLCASECDDGYVITTMVASDRLGVLRFCRRIVEI